MKSEVKNDMRIVLRPDTLNDTNKQIVISKAGEAVLTLKKFLMANKLVIACVLASLTLIVVTIAVTNYLSLESIRQVDKGGYCFDKRSCNAEKNLTCIQNVCECSEGSTWKDGSCKSLRIIIFNSIKIFL